MHQPVLLFDGICNLCNYSVAFILKHEREKKILFAPLQSEAAASLLKKFNISSSGTGMNTLVFIDDGKIYLRSHAAFRIAGYLKSPQSLLRFGEFLPVAITDFFYNLVSKYRYRIFGKKTQCMVPDKFVLSRFLG